MKVWKFSNWGPTTNISGKKSTPYPTKVLNITLFMHTHRCLCNYLSYFHTEMQIIHGYGIAIRDGISYDMISNADAAMCLRLCETDDYCSGATLSISSNTCYIHKCGRLVLEQGSYLTYIRGTIFVFYFY